MKHDADHWWTCECDGCRCISYPSVPAVEPPHTVTVASQYGRDVEVRVTVECKVTEIP